MTARLSLQTILENLISSVSGKVYFQPPSNIMMVYPCIVYERNTAITRFANNYPYAFDQAYKITVIDKDPDSLIPSKIAKLPKCVFDRHYTVDNLHHDVFNLFY